MDPANYIPAPVSGLFETLVEPRDSVEEGQPVARLYSLELPDKDPVCVPSPRRGVTVAVRAITGTSQGDVLVVLGQPTDREALL